jgi:hypothetical protein
MGDISGNQISFEYDDTSDKLYVADSGVSKHVTFDIGTGNVGIGTTNPGSELTVRGATDTAAPFKIESDNGATLLEMLDEGSDRGRMRIISSDGGGIDLDARTTGNIIFDAGDVGIGITNPGAKLEVNGYIFSTFTQAILKAEGSVSGALRIGHNAAISGQRNFEIKTYDGLLRFASLNDAWSDFVTENMMTIDTAGNVITSGTLTVNGDQTGATDYVFDDYNDIELLQKWRNGESLPFETGDLLNRDRLLRDAIVQLETRVQELEEIVTKIIAQNK